MTLRIFGICLLSLIFSLNVSINDIYADAPAVIAVTSSSVNPLTISPNGDSNYDTSSLDTQFHLINIAGFHGWSQSQPGHDKRDFSIAWSIEIRNSDGTVVRVLEDNLLLEPVDTVPAIGLDVALPASWDGKDSSGSAVASGYYTFHLSADFLRTDTLVHPKNAPIIHTKVIASTTYYFIQAVTIDLISPVISIATPFEGAVLGSRTIECTGSIDDSAISSVEINEIAVPVANGQFSTLVTFPADGRNLEILVKAYDAVLNIGQATVNITADTENPVLSNLAPAAGTLHYLNETPLEVSGHVEDLTVVTVKVQGNIVPLVDAYFSTEVVVIAGSQTISIELTDEANNITTSEIEVFGDFTAPVISSTFNPSSESWQKVSEILVTGSLTEANLDKITVAGVLAIISGETFSATIPLPLEGENFIEVKALDLAGNETVFSDLKYFRDTIAPVVSISNPQNGDFTALSEITVTANVIELNVNTASINGVLATGNNGIYTAQIPVPLEGLNTIEVFVEDLASNTESTSIEITRDSILPVLSNVTPVDGTWTADTSILVQGSFDETNLLTITINGQVAQVSGNTFSLDLALVPGANTVAIHIIDKAQNEAHQILTVNHDAIAPVLDIVSPIDGTFTNQSSVLVEGTFVEENLLSLQVNGSPATLVGNAFSLDVILANEGSNLITIEIEDLAGNVGSSLITVIKDTVAPILTVTTPEENYITNVAQLLCEGTVVETNPDSFKINGTIFDASSGTYSGLTDLVEGTNTVAFEARDLAGNVTTISKTVVLDQTAPEITLTSPADNTFTKESQILCEGTVIDDNLSRIVINSISYPLTDSAFSHLVDIYEGTNGISIIAFDLAGNRTSLSREVTLDTVSPELTISSPVDGLWTTNSSILVEGSFVEENVQAITINGVEAQISSNAFSLEVALVSGSNPIEVVIEDKASNSSSQIITVNLDNVPPTVAISSPLGNTFTNETSVLVEGTFVEENLKTIVVNGVVATISGSNFTAQVPVPVEGDNVLTAVIEDLSGLSSSAAISLERDTVLPVISAITPVNGSTLNDSPSVITGTVNDSNLYLVKVNGTLASLSGNSFSYSAELFEGSNTFVIEASDYAENKSETTVTYTLTSETNQPPVLVISSPTQGAYLNSPTINVTGTIEDDDLTSLVVNGVEATITGNTFNAQVTIPANEGQQVDITAIATDGSGNSTSKTVSVSLDISNPVLVINYPFDGFTTSDLQVLVSGTCNDMSLQTVTINGIAAQLVGSYFTLNVLLNPGTNVLEVRATDKAGNNTIKTIAVEQTSSGDLPQIAITSPAERSYLGSMDVTISGIVSGTNIVSVVINGSITASLTGSDFTASISADEGWNIVTAKVTDQAGNESSADVAFTVDLHEPSLFVSSPVNGLRIEETRVLVFGDVYDESPVTIMVNGMTVKVLNNSFATEIDLPYGINEIIVTAQDVAGNTVTDTRTITIAPPAAGAPVIMVIFPVQDFHSSQEKIVITGSISDTDFLSLTFNEMTVPVVNGAFAIPTTLYEGINSNILTALDEEGNSSTKVLNITLDTIPPEIIVFTPEEALTNLDNIELSGRVNEVNLSGVTLNTMPLDVDFDGNFSAVLSTTYELQQYVVSAEDRAGNITTATVEVQKTDAPIIRITDPVEDDILNTLGFIVSGTVSDSDLDSIIVNGVTALVDDGTFTAEVLLGEGDGTIIVTASDLAGHETVKVVNVTIDVTPPTLLISSPENNTVTSAASIVISGESSDVGTDYLPVMFVTIDSNPGEEFWMYSDDTFFEYTANLIADHGNVVTITSIDWAGNETTAAVTIFRDSTSPVLTINTPIAGSVTGTNIAHLSGNISDVSPVTLTVNDVEVPTSQGIFAHNYNLEEGLNTLEFIAKDSARLEERETIEVTLDTIAPEILVTTPSNGSISRSDTITVRGYCNDDHLDYVTINGTNIPLANNSFEHEIALIAGINVLTIEAFDTLGNSNTTQVSVNRTDAPYVTILSPGNNSFTKNTEITVSGTVTDADLASLTVNGTVVIVNGSGYSHTLTLVSGANTITVVATDDDGNVASREVTVTYETTLPEVTIITPVNGSLTNHGLIAVTGGFTEDNLYLISANEQLATIDGSGFTAEVPLTEGANLIRVKAVDKAYNEGNSEITVNYDGTPPALVVNTPINGTITSEDTITVSGTVEDISNPTVTVNGTNAPLTGNAFSIDVALDTGENMINVLSTDGASNVSLIELSVLKDPGAPILALTSPTDGTLTNQREIIVSGSVLDADLVSLTINGIVVIPVHSNFQTTITLNEGSNTITVVAIDEQNNTSSTSVEVISDTEVPLVTITSPGDGTTVASGSLVVAGNVLDANLESVLVNNMPATITDDTFFCNVPVLDGANTITVVATDRAGNFSSAQVIVTAGPNGPPVLTITSPTADSYSSNFEIMDIPGGEWEVKAEMLTRQFGQAAVSANGRIYSIGAGYGMNTHQEYDPATNTWRSRASIYYTEDCSLAEVDGIIYAMGSRYYPTRNIAYNPVTNSWTTKSSLPRSGLGHGAAVIDGKIYVVGGYATNGIDRTNLAEVDTYDPVTDLWESKASLPTPRSNLVVVVAAGKIYAIGGDRGVVNEMYDPLLDAWSPKSSMPSPRYNMSGTCINEQIYLFGGVIITPNGLVTLDSAVKYDPASDTWDTMNSMPLARYDTAAATIGNIAYVMGGSIYSQTNHSFTLAKGFIEVTGTVVDSDLVSVTCNGIEATIEGTSFRAYIPAVSGVTTITVNATDAGGNQTTETMQFTFDNIQPELTITKPQNGDIVGSDPLLITGEVTDNIEILNVIIDGNIAVIKDHLFSVPVVMTTTGVHNLVAKATDRAGNITTAALSIIYDPVNSPQISIETPSEGGIVLEPIVLPDKTWVSKTDLPFRLRRVTATSFNNEIYCWGYATVYVNNRGVDYPRLLKYNTASNTWTEKTPPPVMLRRNVGGVINDKIYTYYSDSVYGTFIYEYDPALDSWSKKARPTRGNIYNRAGTTLNGKLYVTGGSEPYLDIYSPSTNTWAIGPNLPQSRSYHAAAAVGDKLYVIGGSSSNTMDMYDSLTNSWQACTNLPISVGNDCRAIELNGIIYVFGGGGDWTACLAYTPETDSWTIETSIPNSHEDCAIAAIGGSISLIGTSDYPNYTKHDVYTPWKVTVRIAGTFETDSLSSLTVNGVVATISGNTYEAYITALEGIVRTVAIVTDTAGRWTSQTRTFVFGDFPATDAPEISIYSPLDNAILSNNIVAIHGFVQGDNIVEIQVNGVQAQINGSIFECQIYLEEGLSNIEVCATNISGVSDTKNINVFLDTISPTITIVTPLKDALVPNPVLVEGTYVEANVQSITVNEVVATFDNGNFSASVPVPGGAQSLHVRIEDQLGRFMVATRNIAVDNIAPQLSNIQPQTNLLTNETTITVIGNVDDANLETVTINGTEATILNNIFSLTNVPLELEGENTLTIVAKDKANNTAIQSIVVNRDTIAPTLSFLPADGSIDVSPYSYLIINYIDNISGVDLASLTISLNGEDVSNSFKTTLMQAVHNPTTVSLPIGPCQLIATMSDKAGNTSETSVGFNVADNLPPILSNVAPTRNSFSPSFNPYEPPGKSRLQISLESSKDIELEMTISRLKDAVQIRTINYSNIIRGKSEIEFDGKTESGRPLRPGLYTIQLKARDCNGRYSTQHSFTVNVVF
jgi:N-acetylneuraminic acid mutarotase